MHQEAVLPRGQDRGRFATAEPLAAKEPKPVSTALRVTINCDMTTTAGRHLSKEKILFQFFFMLTTSQPSFVASS
jgi:hypothetical protein